MTTMIAQQPAPLAATMPPSPIQTSPQPYTSQAQYTPPSSSEVSTPTPTQGMPSPTENPSRWQIPNQIRPIRKPLYTPVALRRTEKPARQSPPKTGTQYGSPESSFDEFGGERPAGFVPGLARIVTEEWNEQSLGPCTGQPSRNHWKPDTASPSCDDASCDKEFSFLQRRHHCRRCGRIFCHEHSARYVPLDQHARFHSEGWSKYRACESCWSDYRTWESARVSRSNSTNSRDSTVPGTPVPGVAMPINGMKAGSTTKHDTQVAQSVPRDWNWSTF